MFLNSDPETVSEYERHLLGRNSALGYVVIDNLFPRPNEDGTTTRRMTVLEAATFMSYFTVTPWDAELLAEDLFAGCTWEVRCTYGVADAVSVVAMEDGSIKARVDYPF